MSRNCSEATSMSDSRAVCSTCGSQYGSIDPPERCIICDEERQFIGRNGQQWTTASELSTGHRNTWEEVEPGLFAIGVEPKFGIGQRCYLITTGKQPQLLHSTVMTPMLLSSFVCTCFHQAFEQLGALSQRAFTPALSSQCCQACMWSMCHACMWRICCHACMWSTQEETTAGSTDSVLQQCQKRGIDHRRWQCSDGHCGLFGRSYQAENQAVGRSACHLL